MQPFFLLQNLHAILQVGNNELREIEEIRKKEQKTWLIATDLWQYD